MYQVAVRALCEFTAKTGDLDLRFTPSPTAQEGIAGHTLVASRRGPRYESEISLSGEYRNLLVRGRADGYDPVRNQLEEVKTYRGDLGLMPGNHRQLHWAQAKIYGWLMCQSRGLSQIRLALVYFNIVSQQETLIQQEFTAESLKKFFEQQCLCFLDWAEQELAHRTARNQALSDLSFPFVDFRGGQRTLAETVYKAISLKRCLLAEAPTGIGKTIATLFPTLKAMPGQDLDRIFFLTAKTPGRQLALDTTAIVQKQLPAGALRVLELVARDKLCEHPDKACQGDSCPLAQGFYDRLPAARQAAVGCERLDQATLRRIAGEHQVCPYYLSQELARWVDLVIGDYNYYFDLSAMLYALTLGNQWQVTVLADEAHNLVDRARSMYTAELDQAAFRQVRKTAPKTLKKSLDRIQRCWNELSKSQQATYESHSELPTRLLNALQLAIADLTDYFTDQPPATDTALQTFYFDIMHFCRVAELFDQHFLFDITLMEGRSTPGRGRSARLCLRNIVPAPLLKARFEASQATVLFSATLSPHHFYCDLLGLPPETPRLEVESPFTADQLSVHIARHISTRYRDREASLAPIVALMARQFQQQPGNYLAFFSSFEYLAQVAELFRERWPEIPVWLQSPRMDETERRAFLDQFHPKGTGIGFAVLGGAFGEGIDLPGNRLIGAFIATLGLPQVNPVNEQIKQRMDQLFGRGYDYTYFYPGLQKVVQAAGRVIRTQSDRGVIYLIDDRFGRRDVQRLLPGWWTLSA